MNLEKLKERVKEAHKVEIQYGKIPSISYSEFSMYAGCPRRWELAYAQKLKIYTPTIHTVFGTSFHETLQHYLTVLYTKSVKESEQINLREYLQTRMVENYKKEIEKILQKERTPTDPTSEGSEEGDQPPQPEEEFNPHFTTAEELGEFLNDGTEILSYIRKKRKVYFGPKGYDLVGIEVPLYLLVDESVNKVVRFVAFIDLILYDKDLDKIIIIDLKTSTRGWSEDAKKDEIKKAQVLLYKHFFSRYFDIPLDKIDVQFFIVRRKLNFESEFPQKRVQIFKPSQKTPSINKALKRVHHFIKQGYTPEGKYNTSIRHAAIKGKNGNNCKFCQFKDRLDLCPASSRLETLSP